MIYVGRRYTATLTASVDKHVTCEKCNSHFAYRVTRRCSGTGRSPYYLDNDGAQRRAREAAERGLTHALQTAINIVPCPKCGWLQESMVYILRRGKYSWMNIVGIVVAILGALIFGMCFINRPLHDNAGDDISAAVLTILAVASIAGVGLVGLRMRLMSKFDPNANHTARIGQRTGAVLVPTAQVAAFTPQQRAAPASIPLAPPPMFSAPPASAPEWFFVQNDQQRGPVPLEALRQMVATGQLPWDTLIWKEGMPSWAEARDVHALYPPPSTRAALGQPM